MKQIIQSAIFICMLLGVTQTVVAEEKTQQYHEGGQYQRIDPPSPLSIEKDKVEVVEMFFYACPHCYELDPKLKKWASDKPWVSLKRMPAIVGPSWADQARAFYIIEALGGGEKMHSALFEAIHKDGKQIYNEYSVLKFFESQNIASEKVLELYYSQDMLDKVNQARRKTIDYGLRGVPAVVVNGKFVTAPFFVHNQQEMMAVLDSLVEKERAEIKVKTNL